MSTVTLEKNGNIGIMTINRPEALNALNSSVLRELSAAIDEAENDRELYVLILTGAGKSFVAGADIGEMSGLSAEEGKAFGALGNSVFMKLEQMSKPTVCAVNGYALGGGCELSMCCDIRIAGEKAVFGQPETGLGITPGFGGTQRLPRIIGAARAKELIFTARNIKAQEALEIGLVSRVVPQDELMASALELAGKIAANAQIAVRQAKRAINMGLQTDIHTGTAFEAEAFGLCFATEDQKYGMAYFLDKSKDKPEKKFKNR